MSITLDQAHEVINGAIGKAGELGIKLSVSVCDEGGRLVAFARMDGAIWGGVYGSQGKAIASAAFARPSGALAEMADRPIFRSIQAAEGGNIIYSQGAVPIFRNDTLIGAVGTGGGTGQQDEDCASAGVSRLVDTFHRP
ncbi:MAG: heme-binding protein [Chloroflexi bacterium]|nr:heme-binding protein [Chloroflexota bacterium]